MMGPFGGMGPGGVGPMGIMGGMGKWTPVVLVSEIPTDGIASDVSTVMSSLFTLFGVYGDVQRIKVLYTKRNTALLQYQNGEQVSRALLRATYIPPCAMHNNAFFTYFNTHCRQSTQAST